MKKMLTTLIALMGFAALMAQDLSKIKVLNDSTFQNNKTYQQGNKYQRDAMLFVDMLADTHPYYIQKERREALLAGQQRLLADCARCESDSVFVQLLIRTLGPLHDKHTDVVEPSKLAAQKRKQQRDAQAPKASGDEGMMAYKGDLFHYTIDAAHALCYLQFNQCMDARTARNETLPRWDKLLAEMFAKLKEQGIKTLVVDAQYNNGGSSRLCDELMAYLCPLDKLQNLTTYLRFSRLMAAYNPRVGVAKQAWEAKGYVDELYRMPAGKLPANFVQPEVFDGKVIFVQGKRTFSSAGILMTLARDNHIGIIVGTTSTYSPSHYGEVMPYRLPNTNILGSICSKYFVRPDRAHAEDKTLEPDVPIDLSDKQAAWEQILRIAKQ